MKIWVPESLYRAWPWISMASGMFFCATMQDYFSLGLAWALVVYGAVVRLQRAVG